MALAPEWMSYSKDVSPSQGPRFLGRERERGAPKYGRQLSHNSLSYSPSQQRHNPDSYDRHVPPTPFACSVSSPPAPPHAPPSILGDPPSRVLNRSKSSPGFASPKPKPKKSPDRMERNFPSFKPKPKLKPTPSPTNYGKSVSQPNLFNNEKTANWHQQKLQQSSSSSNVPSTPSPLATSSHVASPQPPSTSPPLPSSPPPALVPEIDKLKQLIPTTGMPPKSVRVRGAVGPPLPLTKKPPPPISSVAPASPSLQLSPSTPSVVVPPNALAAYFRKATSEPSLMHHKQGTQGVPGAQVQGDAAHANSRTSKKARAMESEKAQILLLKEAVAAKQPKRSNFFQHLIKKEEQGVPLEEDDSPIGIDQISTSTTPVEEPYSPPLSPPPSTTPPLPSSPAGLRSPLPEDMEDEERFMRTLGWVPDEEDPVPVLAEEEIADVRVKIFLSKAQRARPDGVPVSFDVDVK